MCQARHQAGLQLRAFHLVAQHLDQHEFEQAAQHFAATAALLEGFFEPAELEAMAAHGLATTVHCEDQLRMLESAKPKALLDLYLKINTGMNRLGFDPGEARPALERLQARSPVLPLECQP